MAHALDGVGSDNLPYYYKKLDGDRVTCGDRMEYTYGDHLYSGSIMLGQEGCIPQAGNMGNLYNYQSATISGAKTSGDEPNSICAKGWKLPDDNIEMNSSYRYMLNRIYKITIDGLASIEPVGVLPISIMVNKHHITSRVYSANNVYRIMGHEHDIYHWPGYGNPYASKSSEFVVRCMAR